MLLANTWCRDGGRWSSKRPERWASERSATEGRAGRRAPCLSRAAAAEGSGPPRATALSTALRWLRSAVPAAAWRGLAGLAIPIGGFSRLVSFPAFLCEEVLRFSENYAKNCTKFFGDNEISLLVREHHISGKQKIVIA